MIVVTSRFQPLRLDATRVVQLHRMTRRMRTCQSVPTSISTQFTLNNVIVVVC